MTLDESRQPKGTLTDPNRLTALHLLSLLAVFSGFLLGFICGYDFFCLGGGVGALALTVGGVVLFIGGLALKVKVDGALVVDKQRSARPGKGLQQNVPTKFGRISLFVIGLASFLHPGVADSIEGMGVPPGLGMVAATFLVAVFLALWLGFRMRFGDAAEHMYTVGLGAGLLTVVLYLGVVGVLLPRQAWEKDQGLRRLLGSLGIRSLLGLRIAGYFFLSAVVFVTVKVFIPGLLGHF